MVAQSPMVRVLYGLRNGTLVSARDADRGAACQCTCPGCGGELIARKGPRNRPHFAHAAGDETRGCGETALHYAAKTLLAAPGDFALPGWEPPSGSEVERGLYNLRDGGAAVRRIRQHHSRPARPIRIERAESEVIHEGGRWRTDVQAWVAGQRLQVEIRASITRPAKRSAPGCGPTTSRRSRSRWTPAMPPWEIRPSSNRP
jgi:hypothetical protein